MSEVETVEDSEEGASEEATEKKTAQVVPHEPVTLKLHYPIEHGERRIESITFRPLTAKDMRRGSGSLNNPMSNKVLLEYAAFLSGETTHVIDKLQAADAIRVTGVVGVFFGVSHGTGPEL